MSFLLQYPVLGGIAIIVCILGGIVLLGTEIIRRIFNR